MSGTDQENTTIAALSDQMAKLTKRIEILEAMLAHEHQDIEKLKHELEHEHQDIEKLKHELEHEHEDIEKLKSVAGVGRTTGYVPPSPSHAPIGL